MKKSLTLNLFFLLFLITFSLTAQTVWYVDTAIVASPTGLSWNSPLNNLQDALDNAATGDSIFVSKGTYYPDRGTGDRTKTFVMKSDVVILGGFSIWDNATKVNDRHPFSYETILSGEIQQDGDSTNNTYILVTNNNNGIVSDAVLDGFVIEGAYNNQTGALTGKSAGMYCYQVSPTIRQCTFRNNTVVAPNSGVNFVLGGAVYNYNGSPSFTDCVFENNKANATNSSLGEARGGAVYNDGSASNPIWTDCTFTNNEARGNYRSQDGAIYNDQASKPRFYLCQFTYNKCLPHLTTAAWANGGALYNSTSVNVLLSDCLFAHNTTTTAQPSAFANGGVICSFNAIKTEISSCTFSNNSANAPVGGTANGGAIWNIGTTSLLNISNSILYGNTASNSGNNVFVVNGSSNIQYSNIGNCGGSGSWGSNCGIDGGNNIDTDPFFVDEANDIYETDTCAPGYNAGGGSLFGLAGYNIDLNGDPRKKGGVIDMGAYELDLAKSCVSAWTGAISSDWATAGNWNPSGVPDNYASIYIPDVTNDPVLDTKRKIGSLTLASGSYLSMNKKRLEIYGDINTSGEINGDSASLAFLADVEQEVRGDMTIDSIVIDTESEVAVRSGETRVRKVLQMVEGTLKPWANLTLASDANGTARIPNIPPGAEIDGFVNYEMFISGSAPGWRQITSPIKGTQLLDWNDDFTTSGFPGSDFPSFSWVNVYRYDETTTGDFSTGWTAPTSLYNNVNQGQGYMVYISGTDTVIDAYGEIYTGSTVVNLNYTSTGSATDDGWNMIGNPMPSPVSINSIARTRITGSFYFFDPTSGNYAAWHSLSNTGTLGANGKIAVGQGFWVQANSSPASITFFETSKTSSAQSFLNKTSSPPMRITLLNGGKRFDDAVLRLSQSSLDTYEEEDARKFYNTDSTLLALATLSTDAEHLSVNSLGELTESITIPLMLHGDASTLITLDFEHTAMFDDYCVVLENTLTNQITGLHKDTSLQFTLTSVGENDFLRLRINAKPSISVTVNGEIKEPATSYDICEGDELTLTASGASASSLTWDRGVVNNVAFVPETGINNYTVVENNPPTGCILSNEVEINVKPAPKPEIEINGNELRTGEFATYQWYKDEAAINGATNRTYTFKLSGQYTVEVTDDESCSGVSEATDVSTGNTSLRSTADHLELYPNPGDDKLIINLGRKQGPLTIEITDLLGKVVLSDQFNHPGGTKSTSYVLSHVPSGVYFVSVISESKKSTQKWVKK